MKKKRYEGQMEHLSSYKIYLNVNHLKKGRYHLKIIHKSKIIKNVHFEKD